MTLDKDATNINGKKKASSINGAGLTDCLYVKKMKIDPYLSTYTKFKSKCIKDLNIKPDTLNLVEEWERGLNSLEQGEISYTEL